MDVRECVSRLRAFGSTARQCMCTCCGQMTPVQGAYGFCCWCESVAYKELSEMERFDHIFAEKIGRARSHMKNRGYDQALRIYEELYKTYSDPCLLYAQSLVMIEYSNQEAGLVRYDRTGFMEENAARAEMSASLYSGARLRLDRALCLLQAGAQDSENMQKQLHTAFLCQLKLGRLKAAQHTIGLVEKLGESELPDYEKVVLGCSLGDFRGAAAIAQRLADKSGAALNTFHYLCWLWERTGRTNDARRIIGALGEAMPDGAAFGMGEKLDESAIKAADDK